MVRCSHILLVSIAALVCDGRADARQLNSAFDPEFSRQVAGKSSVAPFSCAQVPPPMVDMSGLESRYQKNDPTQSKIDPAKAAEESARGKVLWNYSIQLGRMADQYMLSNPPREDIADCVVKHLATWGRAGALSGNIEKNHEIGRIKAIMTQAWSLAGFTSVYMKLGRQRNVLSSDDRDVLHFFQMLSELPVKEYSNRNSAWYKKRANNFGLWAGFAVANAGIVLSDRSKVDFGLALLSNSLASVTADGALPAEMQRGERALLYQHFATLPIMGLVALADANGRQLNDDETQALRRLLRFNVERTKSLSSANGQSPKATYKSDLGWADIAVCYLQARDPDLANQVEDLIRTMRPLSHVYYGGSITAAYNPAALAPRPANGMRRCPPRQQ